MMIYKSDIIIRPSPAYRAGDCIFTGSRTKERPRSRGSRPLQAGRAKMLQVSRFLIACTVLNLELPYFLRWTGSTRQIVRGFCQGFSLCLPSLHPPTSLKIETTTRQTTASIAAIHNVRNPRRLRCQCKGTQQPYHRRRKPSQYPSYPSTSPRKS